MFKEIEKNKKRNHTQKKDNKLSSDTYINNLDKVNEGSRWWENEEDKTSKETDEARDKKKKFFKNDKKMSSILPDEEENEKKINKDTPDKLGYFETEEGTVAVGYKRNYQRTDIAFSLVSDIENREEGIPESGAYDRDNYFGKMYRGDEKNFRAGVISFEYDPRSKDIKKIQDNDKDDSNDDEELIYETSKEEEKIDDLEEKENELKGNKNIKEDIEFTKIIHKEKEERNQKFLKEIKKFIYYFGSDKLNEVIASEDEITRRNRILSLSNQSLEIVMMKRRIRKLLEELYGDKLKREEINRLLMKLTKQQMKILLEKLKNQENIEIPRFD